MTRRPRPFVSRAAVRSVRDARATWDAPVATGAVATEGVAGEPHGLASEWKAPMTDDLRGPVERLGTAAFTAIAIHF
jgi:hypothetical protein